MIYFCAGAERSGICRKPSEPFTDGSVMACPCTVYRSQADGKKASSLQGSLRAEFVADPRHPEC